MIDRRRKGATDSFSPSAFEGCFVPRLNMAEVADAVTLAMHALVRENI